MTTQQPVVWVLNHYALPPAGSGGTRHYSLARGLSAHGWCPQLIAASVEHNTGMQRLSADEPYRYETLGEVDFLWINTPTYKGNNLKRIQNMLSYARGVLKRTYTQCLPKPDVVIGSTVHPLAAVAGYLLARRYGVPFIFEVRDLWPETLIDMGKIPRNGLVARVMRAFEKWLYQRSDKIVVLLPKADDYIASLGVPREKVCWIPNGADDHAIRQTVHPQQDRFIFMYFGSHGQANGLEPIIRACAKLRDVPGLPAFSVRFIGDGPQKPSLMRLAKELGGEDLIQFEAPVTKDQIPALASEANAFLLNLRDLPLYRYGISLNKLFDYMAAGRPIVFAGNPVNNPVADADCGICVPPDDADAIAQGMQALLTMPLAARQQLGENGQKHVDEVYSYKQISAKLAAVLNSVTDRQVGA